MRPAPPSPTPTATLLRINEVAAETGLTTRAIRYYEEIGLLEPAARSDGDYRLYDASDLDRLRFIRSLRDDAGFSPRPDRPAARGRRAPASATASGFRETGDPDERRALLVDARARIDRQIEILETKAARLAIDDRGGPRRVGRHLDGHLAELDRRARDAGRRRGARPGRPMIDRTTFARVACAPRAGCAPSVTATTGCSSRGQLISLDRDVDAAGRPGLARPPADRTIRSGWASWRPPSSCRS